MWLLFVEAGIALFLLVFIVWWTMFAGRKLPRSSARKPLPPAKEESEQRD